MAPKKRREGEVLVDTSTTSVRVTRSSTRRLGAKANASVAPAPAPPERPKKKVKKTEDVKEPEKVADGSKTIVIEHCKQCNSFKTRATQVKDGLEKGVLGITVVVNPEKPRRGCFEIREEGGEKFISLLDMKRPFAPMKALDMDKVISDIIDKIK
ncbi:selenoprotein H [Vitis riparia]|uniref:selenoprotein H n=1 Tax=Vitis riparia TaxID=96939 RepID=UPI00155A3B39|nr:selenoprotein H [Vitis riparia]